MRRLAIFVKVESDKFLDHLRDSHYQGAKELNRGVGYQYPHDHALAWSPQQYLPDGLANRKYYQPKETGRYEEALSKRYQQLEQWKNSHKNIKDSHLYLMK